MKNIFQILLTTVFIMMSAMANAQTRQQIEDSLKNVAETGTDYQKAIACSDLMFYMHYKDVKKSIEYGNKAISLANSVGQDSLRLMAYRQASEVYAVWGRSIEALYYGQIALEIQTELDPKDTYELLNNVGDICMDLYDYENAYRLFQKSLKLSREEGNELLETISMFNLGRVYKVQGNYVMALEYINNSKTLSQKIDDIEGIAYSYHELGLISHSKGDLGKAKDYLSMAIEISDSLRLYQLKAQSMVKIANVYRDQHNYLKALENYHKALKESERINDNKEIADAYLGLGSLQLDMNSIESASESLHKGLGYAQNIGSKGLESQFYEQLSKFHEKKSNVAEALKYYKKFKILSDSVFNRDISIQIALMQTQYESEKKDKEIAQLNESKAFQTARIQKQSAQTTILFFGLAVLFVMVIVAVLIGFNKRKDNKMLRQQKEQISAKNRELAKLNKVKDRFFSIISHDLRSPFQSLSGILELMTYDGLSDEELKKVFKDLKLKFDSTNYLLGNLLEWARMQMKETKFDPHQIPLHTSINEELDVIKNANPKNVNLKNSVDLGSQVYADLNMFKLVIRNLVNNAVKFTESEGSIEVQSEDTGDFLCISVKDNGVGISKENQEKIFKEETNFTTTGTALEQGTGLGLNLCKEFVEIHGGKIWVESEEGKGSTFKFTLKKAS